MVCKLNQFLMAQYAFQYRDRKFRQQVHPMYRNHLQECVIHHACTASPLPVHRVPHWQCRGDSKSTQFGKRVKWRMPKGRSVPLDGSVCFWQRRWWSSHSDGSVCFPLHHFSKYKYMSKLDSKHANNQVERNQRKNFDLWMLMSTSSWIATQISGLILMTSYNMKHNHPERINEHIIMRQRK